MLKNIFIQLYFFFSYLIGFGQTADVSGSVFLPEDLRETSGLIFYPPNTVVQINDSGNPPEIIVTDTLGNLIQKYCLPGTENIDWEDLARDEKYIYIGDFGNNLNRRRDLKIYKVETDKVLLGDDSFEMEVINFRYEDQVGFPPERHRRNFDMEAMIHIEDNLYLFSKNRTSPFDGYTYCYRLPDSAGTYTAEKVDSFQTAEGIMESYWITGADYRQDPPQLALLGYDKLWIFYDFEGLNFFSGKHVVLYFNSFTQKESVGFVGKNTIYVSDEKNTRKDGKIYKVNLPDAIFDTTVNYFATDPSNHERRINVTEDVLDLAVDSTTGCSHWEAFAANGQRLYSGSFRGTKFQISTSQWEPGLYELQLNCRLGKEIFIIQKN